MNDENRKHRSKTTSTTLTKKTTNKVKGKVQLSSGEIFVESVVINGKPAFVTKKIGTDEYETVDRIETKKEIIEPCQPELCPYDPYSFTSDEINALLQKPIPIEELFDEAYYLVNRFIYAKEEYKTLIAIDLILSYSQEHLSTVHFPFAVGETESGKSSIMHLVMHAGYRPLYGEGINKANIYNYLGLDEEATGIVIEDEAHQISNDNSKINLYKNSYARGSKYPVIIAWDGNNKRQLFYKTFCQKWLAGESIPDDKGFRERLAIIYMMSGMTEGNIKKLTIEEFKQLQEFRKKILIWKIQNVDKKWKELETDLKQRDKELWEDFLAITHGTKYHEDAKKTVSYFVSQRSESIMNSLEAYLFEILMDDFPANFEINFEDFWKKLARKENTDYNRSSIDMTEHGNISKNDISKMFFQKFQAIRTSKSEKGNDGKFHKVTCYKFDQKMCLNLCNKYKITLPLFHPISESGQSGISNTINPDKD